MGATGLEVEALVEETVLVSAELTAGTIGLGKCALVGGGGGMVPTTGDDIIGGTIGITGAASGSFCWTVGMTSFAADGGRLF